MEVLVDGASIGSEADFHTAFREASGVEWYGGNLDALFDLLVGVVDPPIRIRIVNASAARTAIGPRFDRLLAVIFDAIDYKPGAISFSLESGHDGRPGTG